MIRAIEFFVLLTLVVPSVYIAGKAVLSKITTSSTCNIHDSTGILTCKSSKSKVCVDGLCARHCRELHQDRCLDGFL
jgi:hypothetical protein